MRYDGAVELEEAFAWDCPICQQRNLADYIREEPGEEELTLHKEHNDDCELEDEDGGIGLIEPGDMIRMPYTVECTKCGTVVAVSNHFFGF